MANNTQVATTQQKKSVSDIMAMPAMVSKLNAVWGNPAIAASFSSSLISIVNGNPKLIRGNVCCLDFSVAGYRGDGRLAAYRFDGEQVLDGRKFVWVETLSR